MTGHSGNGEVEGPDWGHDGEDALYLAEYRPGSGAVLSDRERWPQLTVHAEAELSRWRHHTHAPHWTHATGDRLTEEWEQESRQALPLDGWLDQHLETARSLIHYRRMSGLARLQDFPLISRADLVHDVAAFVPLDADLNRAVHGSSSGSTGAALVVPDDVVEVARTFHFLRSLVQEQGVVWDPDPDRVALAYVLDQRTAYTFVSLVTGFAMRPMMRINLHPSLWSTADGFTQFLSEADPQVITGDPVSLASLLESPAASALHPLAIFSGALALSAPLRSALETQFRCPVIDIYGLHETRPIAYRADDGPFRVVNRRIVVEIVDADGQVLPQGSPGEIVVTAGENPLLPLVRYRTGDYGSLITLADGSLGLEGLEGRENTVFVAADGSRVPCIDLTQHLQAHGAWGWTVVQAPDRSVHVTAAGGDAAAIEASLIALLQGAPVAVSVVEWLADLGPGKPRRYVSHAQ